jgi:hypothetical protein
MSQGTPGIHPDRNPPHDPFAQIHSGSFYGFVTLERLPFHS